MHLLSVSETRLSAPEPPARVRRLDSMCPHSQVAAPYVAPAGGTSMGGGDDGPPGDFDRPATSIGLYSLKGTGGSSEQVPAGAGLDAHAPLVTSIT